MNTVTTTTKSSTKDTDVLFFHFTPASTEETATVQLTVRTKNTRFFGLVDLWQVIQLELLLFGSSINKHSDNKHEKIAQETHKKRLPIQLKGWVEDSGEENGINKILFLRVDYDVKTIERLNKMDAILENCTPVQRI